MNGFAHNNLPAQQNLGMINNNEDGLKKQKIHEQSQSITYGECKKGVYHHGEILNCVCIDEKCPQNELICPVCEQESHQDHLVIPLKVFLESIYNINSGCRKNDSDHNINNHSNQADASILTNNFKDPFSYLITKQLNQQNIYNSRNSNGQTQNNNNSNFVKDEFSQILSEIERQHQISIKYFQDYQIKINEGFNECINKLNSFYQGIKVEIQHKRNIQDSYLSNMIQSLQKPLSNDQNNNYSFMNSINSHQDESGKQKRNTKNNKEDSIEKSIKNILKIIGFDQNNNFQGFYKLDLKYALKLCEEKQLNLTQSKLTEVLLTQIQSIINKTTELYGQIPSLSNSQFSQSHSNPQSNLLFLKQLRFSDKLKGNSISIKSPTVAQQTQNESSGQRFCVLEPVMQLNSRYRWGFKIKALVGWIGLGICLVDVIKSVDYEFKYSKIGHGSYLLSGNGYTWSHSKSNQNSQNKSFNFTTGDTIYIEFDPLKKIVKFLKAKTPGAYELEIDFVSTDQFAPCANLCSNGDEIEIINNENELLAVNFE